MATRTEIKISVQSRDNRELPPTSAKVTKVDWDKSERTSNAIKKFGFLIGLTFASIFVHLLHFILVPAFLISSFVFGYDKLKEISSNEGGKGECPKCHLEFNVQPSKWGIRITNNCDHCHEDLEMYLSE